MEYNNVPVKNNEYILIVDDKPENLKLLDIILKGQGFKVRPVTSGEMALKVAEKEKPALILLDIQMPDMDGYEVCRRLKENPELRDIPVIFISALTNTSEIGNVLAAGGADYLSKPYQSEEIFARVSTHLTIHRLDKENQKLKVTRDKFLSIFSDDNNNLLNKIVTQSKFLSEELKNLSQSEIEDLARSLNKYAQSLSRLINNILD